MFATKPEANLSRYIALIDLDCFYAAVEHVRLGIARDVPLAVQQWENVIAVNYAARAAGVTRHERVDSIKKKCPGIRLVHVATLDRGPHTLRSFCAVRTHFFCLP